MRRGVIEFQVIHPQHETSFSPSSYCLGTSWQRDSRIFRPFQTRNSSANRSSLPPAFGALVHVPGVDGRHGPRHEPPLLVPEGQGAQKGGADHAAARVGLQEDGGVAIHHQPRPQQGHQGAGGG